MPDNKVDDVLGCKPSEPSQWIFVLPFKSATQLQYLPETSHNIWTNFRGQDQQVRVRARWTCQKVVETAVWFWYLRACISLKCLREGGAQSLNLGSRAPVLRSARNGKEYTGPPLFALSYVIILNKTASENKFLVCQRWFFQNIDVLQTRLCFLGVWMENLSYTSTQRRSTLCSLAVQVVLLALASGGLYFLALMEKGFCLSRLFYSIFTVVVSIPLIALVMGRLRKSNPVTFKVVFHSPDRFCADRTFGSICYPPFNIAHLFDYCLQA